MSEDDEEGGEALLRSLLRDHPRAAVSAFDGMGRVVEFPRSIELAGDQLVQLGSPFELIDAGSRLALVGLWAQAKAVGHASGPLLLLNATAATCHIVDVRARHGVFVGMVTTLTQGALVAVLADRAPAMPRMGRVVKDEMGVIGDADENICRILRCSVDDLIGSRSLDLVHPDDHVAVLDAWMDMLITPGSTVRVRARHRRGDGSWIWLELTNVNRLDQPEGGVMTEMIDVSTEMEALEALRHSEQLLRRLAEALPSGVLHLDARRNIIYTNGRLREVVGVDVADSVDRLLATVIPEDHGALESALRRALVDGRDADLEVRLRPLDASTVHLCAIAVRALTDAVGAPDGAVLCIDDVTESAELRVELERRATVDDLTGCFNRATVLEELDRVLRRHLAGSPGTAVVYLDLDGFKEINDSYGHETGDQLLSSVVRRLSRLLRAGDLIGRLGGDEFIVVLSSVDGLDEAAHVGRRIEQALSVPLEVIQEGSMRIRASIGVAWSAATDVTAAALTAAADRAMYKSKRAGKSQPVCVAV